MAEQDGGGTAREQSPVVEAPDDVLPTERELELEVLLKERDEHLTRLANEVRLLRRRLPSAGQATPDESVVFPPSVTNLVLPLLSKGNFTGSLTGPAGQALSGPASATVTAALTARLAALHLENEELYELLKRGAVGRLREEVRELRVTARKLEGALQESHTVISQLKTELEESYRAIERNGEIARSSGKRSRSPQNHYRQKPQSFTSRYQQDTKPIPTGPRALKKPRLSDTSQEFQPSSGYRGAGRPTVKQEDDSRMKVEEVDYEPRDSGVRDDDQYSDYYQPKSEKYSQYSRSLVPVLLWSWTDRLLPKSITLREGAKIDETRIRRKFLHGVEAILLVRGRGRALWIVPLALRLLLLPTSTKLTLTPGVTRGRALRSTLLSVDEGRSPGQSLHHVLADDTLVLRLASVARLPGAVLRPVDLDLLLVSVFTVQQGVLRTETTENDRCALRLRHVSVEVIADPPLGTLVRRGRGNVGIGM
ncbi:hypothetical protein FRB90_007478 [Tulasnella sp. 427]|nr:hypothetical protein FRB90_007478 [Tulasnella sp. 427]